MNEFFCSARNTKSTLKSCLIQPVKMTALWVAVLLAACSSDSSSDALDSDAVSNPQITVDSAIDSVSELSPEYVEESELENLTTEDTTETTDETMDVTTEETSYLYTIDSTLAVTPDEDGFYDIADIYKAAPATSKIAFVIRHSERESDTGQETPLTEAGVEAAQALGTRIGGSESFYYASTDFVRTRETANNIAIGRGETAEVVTWDAIDGNYFYREDAEMSIDSLAKRSQNLTVLVARYCYNYTFPNAATHELVYASFYPLYERGYQFVNEVILANMPNWNRVSILVSHDVLAEPLLVYATNGQIDLKFHEAQTSGRWVNYLSGIAVVVNEAGEVSLFPVKGNDLGWM